eukprot:TRINITY_DN60989_c0_g1_i1.p1 TRINITY_DN60989_c0_g1~~TRINITY_DN60989_c0_g1_i1.p1  ORF type:complete len:780 (+),score=80.03 TRINITY_DN60989_c0_g1_i1:180-2342(+)
MFAASSFVLGHYYGVLGLRGIRSLQADPVDACRVDSGGTCKVTPCSAWRGSTRCINGKCLCSMGFFATADGRCVESLPGWCKTDPVGTCRWFGCDASRGPTTCQNGQCMCSDGYCADGGRCVRKGECTQETSGTCKYFPCSNKRGPTECVGGRCVCNDGFCLMNNVCVASTSAVYAEAARVAHGDKFPGPHSNVRTALCVSGGGSRSLSLTMGALRALEQLDLMQYVDAISAVSGGSWATSIYMFADVPITQLLGRPTTPKGMDAVELQASPGRMGLAATQHMEPFIVRMLETHLEDRDKWIWFVSQYFLAPFGLNGAQKMIAGSAEQLRQIKKRNPELANSEFLLPVPGRPKVFVICGAILGPVDGYTSDGRTVRSLQVSPDVSGSPYIHGDMSGSMAVHYRDMHGASEDLIVGGGFVETFAFGSPAPKHETDGVLCIPTATKPFTLAAAIGISSSAFAAKFANSQQLQGFTPTVRLWPVESEGMHNQRSVVHKAGDGGNIENAGLLPMLQRGAKRIVWLINSDVGITRDKRAFCPYAGRPSAEIQDYIRHLNPNIAGRQMSTNQMTDKFGWGLDDAGSGYLSNNQVFSKEDYMTVGCELQKLRDAGKPAVYRSKLRILDNDFWGITGGWKVDLTFVYNEWCEDFVSLLPPPTQELARIGREGSGELAHFPFIKTMFENYFEAIALTNAQVNLLAAQSEYFIQQNSHLFKDVLSPTRRA